MGEGCCERKAACPPLTLSTLPPTPPSSRSLAPPQPLSHTSCPAPRPTLPLTTSPRWSGRCASRCEADGGRRGRARADWAGALPAPGVTAGGWRPPRPPNDAQYDGRLCGGGDGVRGGAKGGGRGRRAREKPSPRPALFFSAGRRPTFAPPKPTPPLPPPFSLRRTSRPPSPPTAPPGRPTSTRSGRPWSGRSPSKRRRWRTSSSRRRGSGGR